MALYAHEIVVKTGAFPDYVFKEDYELMSLNDLRNYIYSNGHLPNIPSAKEGRRWNASKRNGNFANGKIEELTLYILELQKQINEINND